MLRLYIHLTIRCIQEIVEEKRLIRSIHFSIISHNKKIYICILMHKHHTRYNLFTEINDIFEIELAREKFLTEMKTTVSPETFFYN